MSVPVYRLHQLTRYYGDRRVLDIEGTSLEEGKVYAVVGPNGAGKTTLLRVLGFLDAPSSGKLYFRGEKVDFSAVGLGLRRQVALVMQSPFLLRTTVFKNTAYGLKVRGMSGEEMWHRVEAALALVGLAKMAQRKAASLSGGEAQRLAVARALAVEPAVLLLDEPTANVDAENTRIIEQVVGEVRASRGTTVILSTHDLVQAFRVADEVYALSRGRLKEAVRENLFRGEIVREGEEYFFRTDHLEISVAEGAMGRAHIAIDPTSIIVSTERLSSSARNCLFGPIVKVEDEDSVVRVTVNVGDLMVARITKQSFCEMGLNVGSSVYLTFKSTSVKVLEVEAD